MVPERQDEEFFLAVRSQWKNPERILLQRLPAKWRFIFASRKEQCFFKACCGTGFRLQAGKLAT